VTQIHNKILFKIIIYIHKIIILFRTINKKKIKVLLLQNSVLNGKIKNLLNVKIMIIKNLELHIKLN